MIFAAVGWESFVSTWNIFVDFHTIDGISQVPIPTLLESKDTEISSKFIGSQTGESVHCIFSLLEWDSLELSIFLSPKLYFSSSCGESSAESLMLSDTFWTKLSGARSRIFCDTWLINRVSWPLIGFLAISLTKLSTQLSNSARLWKCFWFLNIGMPLK